jgi:hypothetical protein
MRTPDEVATMQRLHGLGWGTRRTAAEVGATGRRCSISGCGLLGSMPGSGPAQPTGTEGDLAKIQLSSG